MTSEDFGRRSDRPWRISIIAAPYIQQSRDPEDDPRRQVKLNDPGASQYLIETWPATGGNGLLRFYRRNLAASHPQGDAQRAAQAMRSPSPIPTRRRCVALHGLSLINPAPGRGRARCRAICRCSQPAADAPFIRQMIS